MNLFIETKGSKTIDKRPFEIVERKGLGHPDTISDAIAEKISAAYSKYCLKEFGVVLRHMVDKIAVAGGSTKVYFGGGKVMKPIKIYLNGRFTENYGENKIPFFEISRKVIFDHLKQVMPLIDINNDIVIIDGTHSAPGPGVVWNEDGTSKNERKNFFSIPKKELIKNHSNKLRSNDTSTGVGYGFLSQTESAVINTEEFLNSRKFKEKHPYVGTDIKVMAHRKDKNLSLTLCIPFISKFTPSSEFYFQKLDELRKIISEYVINHFSFFRSVDVFLNTRDDKSNDDYYLTLLGSALESGDEGAVGRGNRINGVIPFTQRATLEAACGKNPVYHVGKLYTVASVKISEKIYDKLGIESIVYLVSQMGRPLSDPWNILIEIFVDNLDSKQETEIQKIISSQLANLNQLTMDIIDGKIRICS